MTTTKAAAKTIRKLSLKKSTVKDLDLKGQRGADVRGGRSGSTGGSAINRSGSGGGTGT